MEPRVKFRFQIKKWMNNIKDKTFKKKMKINEIFLVNFIKVVIYHAH